MAHYKTTNRTQGLFLSINLAEQLLPGSYEFTLQQIIDKHIDLVSFDH
jgi:hypothetical protein